MDKRGQVYAEDPAALAAHARKMWRAWFAGAAVNAVTMPAGAVAWAFGSHAVAAAAGVVALMALPLPFLPVLLAHRMRPRRRIH
ncbi:hypothetical protein IAI18_16125 [Acetobacteraceae bacterium H6797]|nr:hypothetical protein [Acetobacteraceae bacterium H6797]